jgi:hypothetical protein
VPAPQRGTSICSPLPLDAPALAETGTNPNTSGSAWRQQVVLFLPLVFAGAFGLRSLFAVAVRTRIARRSLADSNTVNAKPRVGFQETDGPPGEPQRWRQLARIPRAILWALRA